MFPIWSPRAIGVLGSQAQPPSPAPPLGPERVASDTPAALLLCKFCSSSFTSERKRARPRAKFAEDVVLEAVRLYIQSLASYQALAAMFERRFGQSVGRVTLNNWVYELGGMAKTPLEVSAELLPQWGEFLSIDGKAI